MKESIKENTVEAVNQIKEDQKIFFVGEKTAPVKIAIVGNSITRHAVKESIGWYKMCGMAASSEETDYVHVLHKMLSDKGIPSYMMVNQLAYWERHYKDNILENYKDIQDFNADYFIFRLGENIISEDIDMELEKHIDDLVNYICSDKTKAIMTTCFWKHKQVDNAIRLVAEKNNHTVVELGDLGDRDDMKAIGLYENSGVAAHPGDKGMEYIAQRIANAIS